MGVAEPTVPPRSRDLAPRVDLVDRADPLISLLLGGLLLNGCRLRGDGHGSRPRRSPHVKSAHSWLAVSP